MRSSASIKYKYAFDSKQQIVDVRELQRSEETRNEVFTCISCENILIPRLGEIKRKHFAHKHTQNCSEETYLHKLAKLTFEREYCLALANNEPFYIELKIDRRCIACKDALGKVCYLESVDKLFDLTKRYKKISLEVKNDEFIPDILLSDLTEEKNLFVEIAVTHEITCKKVESKIPIIEISIQNEDDILLIKERIITQKDSRIRLVNLNIQPEERSICKESECPERIGVFVVYSNGKSILSWERLPKAKSLINSHMNGNILYCKLIGLGKIWSSSDEYKRNLIEAYNNRIDVKNCFLCRYHGENRSYYDDNDDEAKPIFCKFLKIKCKSNYASECQYYKPDERAFPDL